MRADRADLVFAECGVFCAVCGVVALADATLRCDRVRGVCESSSEGSTCAYLSAF